CLHEQRIWVVWDRVQSDAEELVQQQWLIDIGIDVRQTQEDQLTLHSQGIELHMQWLGDRPTFDIAQNTLQADSKRGLIGVGWKKMKPTTSVHAMYQSKNLESIVVISAQKGLQVEMTDRDSMNSIKVKHGHSKQLTKVKYQDRYTEVIYNR